MSQLIIVLSTDLEQWTHKKKTSNFKSSICHENLNLDTDIYPVAYFATWTQSELGFVAKNCKLQSFLINQFYEGAYWATRVWYRKLFNGTYHLGRLIMVNIAMGYLFNEVNVSLCIPKLFLWATVYVWPLSVISAFPWNMVMCHYRTAPVFTTFIRK